jgi:hypothetical protein
MNTTLIAIRAHSPCAYGWARLLRHLGKTTADDEPLAITTIIDSNGLRDALWCLRAVNGHDREIRLYAVWCARQVQHLITDPRLLAALDVAERHAHGEATDSDLAAASYAAWAAARAGAGAGAGNAASAAAGDAASAAAEAAASAAAAAWAAARAAAGAAAGDAASAAAEAAAWDAASAAAEAAAGDAQEARLRDVCAGVTA